MDYPMMEWTEEKIKRFWDYESRFPHNYFAFQVGHNLIPMIRKYSRPGTTVLDYGAGPGFLMEYLLKAGLKAAAIEFSEETLAQLRDRFNKISGFQGAFTPGEILSRGTRFDLILLIEVIEHLDDRYLKATSEIIHSLLVPEGFLIITTPNNEDLSKSMILCPETGKLFHRWQHVRSWNAGSLSAFVSSNGFRIIKTGVTDFNFQNIVSIMSSPYQYLRFLYRKLFMQNNLPHLYCICSPAKS